MGPAFTTDREGKCPLCGRAEGACRAVPMGFWCQRDGLLEDTSLRIHPTPDPTYEAITNDPDVIAATVARDLAQATHDERHEAWLAALTDLSTARITGSAQVFDPADGYRPVSKRDAKKEQKLIDAERRAERERERAHEDLVAANENRRRALANARALHTGQAP